MNKEIMKQAGLGRMVELVDAHKCPTCEQEIGAFKDELSLREFRISGMCQSCQDGFFKGDTNLERTLIKLI